MVSSNKKITKDDKEEIFDVSTLIGEIEEKTIEEAVLKEKEKNGADRARIKVHVKTISQVSCLCF